MAEVKANDVAFGKKKQSLKALKMWQTFEYLMEG
jgi:hypothetical protein